MIFGCYTYSMELSDNAKKILNARYLLKDETGKVIESPEEMFWRIAKTVARAETSFDENVRWWEEQFHELLSSLRFLPNSPAIMNAGKEGGQLAACFVLPVEDSIRSIFSTLKDAALILQTGGGTGFSFSHLRPMADVVRSTGGIASGPVSFMKIFNTTTDVIKQGGARRGANMGILRVDHPDILDFVRIKRDAGELANFNISVAVTDAFMAALEKDEPYEVINPRNGRVVEKLAARTVFDEIVASAWETGDPGLIFIDRINRANPTPNVGTFESTNPCGEQPLLPYEACVLGSINVAKYFRNGGIDYGSLETDVKTAVRFLDDTIEVNSYPTEAIELMHRGNRKIGLGIMGWADLLVLLGIPYNHPEAFAKAREVMKFVQEASKRASRELAASRGRFPNFPGSVYDLPGARPLRNATTTTIAPTGTISAIANCSGGIEPYFALAYKRFVLDTELTEINPLFIQLAKEQGFYSEDLLQEVLRKGSVSRITGIPSPMKGLFRTALEIPPEDHIEMQAAFQKYTDNAVSKTINLPHRAKKEDVARVFALAYRKGCKGITVFRYGARKGTMAKFADVD
ncbi:adenosylcobalamin-dependent ribonucleoside-diphosphate reductase [Geotalea sp. SG265]|uniref:adenosylcobalamin-dependent ribonucleoside-diphosphate reductase n=1 Tax=Geotalea sp. SG265 TaxID=2922867 RepID=UPI001FAF9F89|nr:adenosylcobalamin-dependent ribonucleoside-diphosphate reductase [Geotalea sp. SG265]